MTLPIDWSEQLQSAYPKRSGPCGWRGMRLMLALRRALMDSSWEEIIDGCKNYKAYCQASGKEGTDYVQHRSVSSKTKAILNRLRTRQRRAKKIFQGTNWQNEIASVCKRLSTLETDLSLLSNHIHLNLRRLSKLEYVCRHLSADRGWDWEKLLPNQPTAAANPMAAVQCTGQMSAQELASWRRE